LHLVPLTYISPSYRERRRKSLDSNDENIGGVEDDEFIAAADGIRVVSDPLIDTFAPGAVEEAVWRRISGSVCRLHRHHCSSLILLTVIPLRLRVMYIKQKLSFLEILSRP
jgi:hypothetical protein